MAVNAALHGAAVTVHPGNDGRAHVTVRNSGSVVDQFTFSVLGDGASWTTVRPAQANLLPDQECTVELTFSPPRSHEVLAGEVPFGLRVASREDVEGSVVQEGTVTVLPFTELTADVVPVTSRGSRRGRHTVAVDNLGNTEHPFQVELTDPDARLEFRIRPKRLLARPGRCTFVRVRVVPHRRFWRGADRPQPFRIAVRAEPGKPVELDATYLQRSLLPKRAFLLLSILLMVLVALALLISTVLNAKPRSIAGPSPSRPVTPPTTTASATSSSPAPTTSSASSAPRTASGAAPLPAPAAPVAPTAGSVTRRLGSAAGSSTTFTISPQAYPGVNEPQLFSYVVPAGRTYRVVSVRFADPAPDTGSAQVRAANRAVTTFDLAATGNLDYAFPSPFTVTGGQVVTLAVTCRNRDRPCDAAARFTATVLG